MNPIDDRTNRLRAEGEIEITAIVEVGETMNVSGLARRGFEKTRDLREMSDRVRLSQGSSPEVA